MAVRIRMKMMGRKHRPYFHIVAIDARQPRDGRILEDLGSYDPMVKNTDERVKLRRNGGHASEPDLWRQQVVHVVAEPTALGLRLDDRRSVHPGCRSKRVVADDGRVRRNRDPERAGG